MHLGREAKAVLSSSRIGLLALRAGRLPIVNPAAYHYGAGSLWMTTSRFAVKTMLARRDPRAAFFIDGGSHALQLRGTLEVFDPISVSSQVRALLGGPAVYLGMAGYTLKNAPFIAGYLLDIARIPREWLPYNRVVLRLVPSEVELVEVSAFAEAQAARVPSVPAETGRRLAGVARGYVCWLEGAKPVMRPAMWEVDHGQVMVATVGSRHPRPGVGGALVIESHHPFRPSLMVGACLRGTFGSALSGEAIGERYGLDATDVPPAAELHPERVTSWRGFQVTSTVPRSARRLRVAHA